MSRKDVFSKLSVLLLVLSLALFIGCAKPPTAEMEKAEKAVAEATAKEANLYAEEAFKKAEAALKNAKDLVGGKKYKEAKAAAEEAAILAGQSVADLEANKAKMKTEADQLIVDLQKEMENLKGLVVAAVKKKVQVSREEVQAAIGKAEVDLTAVKDQLQGGKIRQAMDLLKAIGPQLKTQTDNVNTAMEAPPVADKKK